MSSESRKSKNPKQKDQYLQRMLRKWQKLFAIPQSIKIETKYVTHRHMDDERQDAEVFSEMAEYGKVLVEVYDDVFSSKDFEATAEETACHEMLHVALLPITSYCNNMFSGDEGKQKELTKLEEAFITSMVSGLVQRKR